MNQITEAEALLMELHDITLDEEVKTPHEAYRIMMEKLNKYFNYNQE